MRPTLVGILLAAGVALTCASAEVHDPAVERPSFLVIVADDLGYSDLGAYGGEIPTPNLDALAISGLRATDFYVSCRGAPSRAMLLTGVDNHVAGFGVSDGRHPEPIQKGQPGYEGRLSERVVTVASLLRDAGYHTSMAGKWALGEEPGNLPRARGFERSFVLHDAAASHWQDMRSAVPRRPRARYTRDGADVESLPAGYFSTRFFTDFVLESIAEARAAGRPFFSYLSFQAPHGPLADDERVSFSGRYDEGFDAIRNARLLRMKTLGLLDQSVQPYPGIPTVPSWSDLS
ncbi:MAG: sulfatase-like hydrolase/transferase, partial [Myxococcota bacterium]